MAYEIGKFKYHSTYQGDEGLVLPFAEGPATETFVHGDLVKLSSGKIIIAVKSSADVVLGFALDPATGTEDTILRVQVIRPSDVFIVHYDGDDTFAVANVGVFYESEVANAIWEVNQDATGTTDALWEVLGSAEVTRGATGPVLNATAGGPVYVRFNPSNIEFGKDV